MDYYAYISGRIKPIMMKLKVFASALAALSLLFSCQQDKDPVDYVDPYIGNVSHLLVPTFPTVHLPNSMLRVFPKRWDYTTEKVDGFPIIVTNHRETSPFTLSVTQGEPQPVVSYAYDKEKITPYSYEVTVADGDIDVRFSVSHQSAMYAIDFLKDGQASLILDSANGEMTVEGNTVKGSQVIQDQTKVYLYLETMQHPVETSFLDPSCAVLKYDGNVLNVRYGVSFISVEQAEKNLRREISHYDVDKLMADGRKIWNDVLGRMEVKGGDDDEKTVFYTSYYRNFERPVCISEDGQYWSGFDNSVHEDGGVPFYNDDWIWDTYHASHPLRIMMNKEVEEDILASYLRMAEQMGTMWMPTFPGIAGDSRRMNANHGIATFADAIVKGLDVDKNKAWEASYKGLTEKTLIPWRGTPNTVLDEFYWENGYMPALGNGEKEFVDVVDGWEKRQPVAVSLGTAYNCWCLALIAESVGETQKAEYFRQRSLDYRNLYNSKTGFFHPKDAYGNFIEPFDYNFCGGMGGREYYDENNAWEYRWDVKHNIPDLIELMGGNERFVAQLDSMFAEPMGRIKFEFYAKYPDHTGNVGQFSMSNEPGMHVPYLYNYAGAPWKTQKRVRQMLDTWFRSDLMGVPGDEDGGGLTAFALYSMLGFYPVTPGEPVYSIGSPVFPEVKIHLTNGKIFTVKADGVSRTNKYIQSATLNGKPLDKPVLTHETLMNGGELRLKMSDRPNKEWGK